VPSRWEEPFGRVALEAAACGCATITSNKGGLSEANKYSVNIKNINSIIEDLNKKFENRKTDKFSLIFDESDSNNFHIDFENETKIDFVKNNKEKITNSHQCILHMLFYKLIIDLSNYASYKNMKAIIIGIFAELQDLKKNDTRRNLITNIYQYNKSNKEILDQKNITERNKNIELADKKKKQQFNKRNLASDKKKI